MVPANPRKVIVNIDTQTARWISRPPPYINRGTASTEPVPTKPTDKPRTAPKARRISKAGDTRGKAQFSSPPLDGGACVSLDIASDSSQMSRSTVGNTERPFHLRHAYDSSPRCPKRTFRKRYNAFANQFANCQDLPCS